MIERFDGASYEDLRARFRWSVPERFNIGVACSDRHPHDRVAMLHEHAGRPHAGIVGGTSAGRAGGLTEVFTYGELSQLSNRLANALRAFGVRRGDRVAVALPQHPAVAISHIAVYKLGAVAVPLTTLFGPDALAVRLRDSGAVATVTNEATLPKIETCRPELPDLRHVITLERDWEATLAGASPRLEPVETAADDPAFFVYTSGTTGAPKGAVHGHRALLGHLSGFELSHDFYGQPGDKFWTPADWAWIGGLYDAVFPVLYHGSTILSFAHEGPFDPERAAFMMAKYEIRNTFLPPTALKLMRRADLTLPQGLALRTVGSGGEPLGEQILNWGRERLGVTINEFYGQTECNYVVGNCQALYPVCPGSMGRPYVGHTVAVVDREGQAVTGEPGEIAVTRPDPVMFLAYWRNPEATHAKFLGDWMLTGDTGVQDDDGYLWFQGRTDDVISSAGYRIGPAEIEDCLLRHPSVTMAAVIGVPDEIRGQVVKAYVVTRPGEPAHDGLAADIQGFVRSRLAAYLYPREIEFIEEMPLTTTGKIRRNELRALHERTRQELQRRI